MDVESPEASLESIELAADAFIAEHGVVLSEGCDVELDGRPSRTQLRYIKQTVREATGDDPFLLITNDSPSGSWHVLLMGFVPI